MTIQVKDNIPLTKELRKTWEGSRVMIFSTRDALFIKRLQKTPIIDIRQKLKSVGKKITAKDIASALRAARE
jgi:hypothetical protein